MDLTVDIQVATTDDDLPDPAEIRYWVSTLLSSPLLSSEPLSSRLLGTKLSSEIKPIELSVRIVDRDESQQINNQYRDKNKPTNVLSFPSDLPDSLPFLHLGDLIICAPVVREEAIEQGKPLPHHWAHMVVHGTLHLLGYDHINDRDAELMEGLEIALLQLFDIANPYQHDSLLQTAH